MDCARIELRNLLREFCVSGHERDSESAMKPTTARGATVTTQANQKHTATPLSPTYHEPAICLFTLALERRVRHFTAKAQVSRAFARVMAVCMHGGLPTQRVRRSAKGGGPRA